MPGIKVSEEFIKRFGKKFPAEAPICKEGDVGSTMFLIQSGKVAILKSTVAGEKLLATLGEGEFFGEMALMGLQDKRSASAKSVAETQVLELSPEAFEGLVRRSPEIAITVIRTLCERVREANHKVAALAHKSDATRIASLIASLCEEKGVPAPAPSPGRMVKATDDAIATALNLPLTKVTTFLSVAHKAQVAARSGEYLWVPFPQYLVPFGDYIATRSLGV